MKIAPVFFMFAGLVFGATPNPTSAESTVIRRNGWSFDRSEFRENAATVAAARKAGKAVTLSGWVEYDITVAKGGWYELWLSGCQPEWPRSVFMDGNVVTRLQAAIGADLARDKAAADGSFKEVNLYLTTGPHVLRILRWSFPGMLPAAWELRSSEGRAEGSARVTIHGSRFGAPGSGMTAELFAGGIGKEMRYEFFWENEIDGTRFPAANANVPAGDVARAQALRLILPKAGLYSLRGYAEGRELKPADLKAGLVLSSAPTSRPADVADTAPFQFAGIFADQMVLQRDKDLPVWGWATPHDVVTVSLGGQTRKTTADDRGNWRVQFQPISAGAGALELQATSATGKVIRCSQVVMGDVWVLSGQSNMGGPLLASTGGRARAEKADFPNVRLAVVQPGTPAPDGGARLAQTAWNRAVAGGNAASAFALWNAIPFAFGTKIESELQVPVGLISANRGGTYVSTWISRERHETEPSLRAIIEAYRQDDEEHVPELLHLLKLTAEVKKWRERTEAARRSGEPLPAAPVLSSELVVSNAPGLNYSRLIAPLGPLAIRGILWYQGESDSSMAAAYATRFPLLVENWRQLWRDPNLPFLYVQIAYGKGDLSKAEPGDFRGAELKDVQRRALSLPHTAMAVTDDLMKPGDDVHYPDKLPVGERLALAALATVYGKPVIYSGPLYRSHEVEAGRIRLRFDHLGGGLRTKNDAPLGGFIIAGADHRWFRAEARIEGETVVVSHPEVPSPLAVRYSWAEQPSGGNLVNAAGLPAAVFRTDDWPLTTAGVFWEKKN